ncbi:MAG TPA: chemotaxis response regulator protein-glutamate methylesterase [Nocardioidaceae bacterium]|nr:chemotaxis response regulator protein-glutamate methylesterase [Nocardioidaceae bacterium]
MARIRVLVVDDSVVVRKLVTDVLAGDPRIEVVGTAANGKVALSKMAQVNPDLVTLDIEMPVMDGLATLVELRTSYPRLPVVMFSTLTERGTSSTLDALERGANDYVTKPANVGSVTASMEAVRAQLIPKIIALCTPSAPPASRPRTSVGAAAKPVTRATVTRAAPAATASPARVDVLAIGVSTGGPDALTTVLTRLPADLPVPVLVVQHMPPLFTKQFADRLDAKSVLRVSEATRGDAVLPGRVLIAPGDFHLRTRRCAGGVVASLDQGTPENYCRPAVDVLFRSVAETYGQHVLAVVLTGMGTDGARSCRDVVAAGGSVIVQDQATSVVWGMPGAVAGAGLASEILPLPEMVPAILTRLRVGRSQADTRQALEGARP